MSTTIIDTPFACGIDTVYYFAESGAYYDKFFIGMLEQIADKKKEFEAFELNYADSDIVICVNDIDIKYSGKGRDGFHWFKHEFFRIGFKDEEKNRNVNDIYIQLNAIGIYTLGLSSLIEYINKKLLKDIVLEYASFPITRIDVNMFIEHNFSYLKKEMVVSKKKNHSIHYSEKANSSEVETYYIGKPPFKLRIYNKTKELNGQSQAKQALMLNHFGIHGLDTKNSIWNVEFELHREFLKRYGIETLEQSLKRSNELFKLGCDLVKFVDTDSIKAEQIQTKNRRLADTLPIWEYIKASYDNKEFMQITTPLERIERISYRYTLEEAKKPIKRAIKRLMVSSSSPTLNFFLQTLEEAKEEIAFKNEMAYQKQDKENLSAYSDEGLQKYEEKLAASMRGMSPNAKEYHELSILYVEVDDELVKRGLSKPIPF